MCYHASMKPSEKTIKKLTNFFKNLYKNEEASSGEVEVFLNDYLDYIFQLHGLDLSKYDITISKVKIDERYQGRETTYKSKCNSEDRKYERRKVLNRKPYVSDGSDNYFDAIMVPSKTIENKYTIYVNENSCRMKSDDDLEFLINLFQVFGHEVHHIIQYIRYKKDVVLDDDYLRNKEAYKAVATNLMDKTKARQLIRLINRHIDMYNYLSKIETKADQKGYDYLDILFNDIIDRIPKLSNNEQSFYETDSKYYKTEQGKAIRENDAFLTHIYSYKDINEDLYKSRSDQYERIIRKNEGLDEDLMDFDVDPFDFVFPSLKN